MDRYTFFDFCSGIGGGHAGLSKAGFLSVGYSEINLESEKTYKLLHNTSSSNYGDLMLLNPKKLPDFDIMLAGFPCQSFSIVGLRTGFNDERGQVIFGLSEILKIKQPKMFLLENVKGLVNINNGETLNSILSLLKGCGYTVFYKVLNSVSYGVPQLRERIYLIGFRTDLEVDYFSFPQTVIPSRVGKFLIDRRKEYLLTAKPKETFTNLYLNNKYNKGKFSLSELLNKDFRVIDTRQSDLRIYENYVPTLRTGRQGILYVYKGEFRKLSGYEALLLQGFDKTASREVSLMFPNTSLLAQAGNAMTVNVIEEIGKSMIKAIQ